MDRAGWHITGVLEMPKNIIPIFLPPGSLELNPVENYETIVDACCVAWNRLIDRP